MIVLAIEDNLQEMALLREALASSTNTSFLVEHAERLAASLSCLAARRFDAILLDLNLPDSNGLDTLARVQAQAPELPVVILTDLSAEPLAMLAVQNGAQDYVFKGSYAGESIHRSLRTAVERKRLMTDLNERIAGQESQRVRLFQEHQVGLLELAQSKAIISGDFHHASQAITETVSRVLAVERASIWLFQEEIGRAHV